MKAEQDRADTGSARRLNLKDLLSTLGIQKTANILGTAALNLLLTRQLDSFLDIILKMANGHRGHRSQKRATKGPENKGHSSAKKHGQGSSAQPSSSKADGSLSNTSSGNGQRGDERNPQSAKKMSAEMRLAKRRRQNNESSRRSRERKRMEEEEMKAMMQDNNDYIEKLEGNVRDLKTLLEEKRKAKGSKSTKRNRRARPGPSPGEYFEKEPYFGDPF